MGSGLTVLVCWLFRWNVSHAVPAASRIHSNQALIRYRLVLTQTGSSTELSSELVALSSTHKAEGSHTRHLLLYKHDSAAFSTTHTHTALQNNLISLKRTARQHSDILCQSMTNMSVYNKSEESSLKYMQNLMLCNYQVKSCNILLHL